MLALALGAVFSHVGLASTCSCPAQVVGQALTCTCAQSASQMTTAGIAIVLASAVVLGLSFVARPKATL